MMLNKAMERKLASSEALDVLKVGQEIEPGLYLLREFTDGVDYCDAEKEAWIWSIGKHWDTGVIRAATDARFYQDPAWECLWLR